MDNSSIIMRIEIRLKELGKTKSEFYKGAGITSATFSQWNTNLFSPSRRKLEGVAQFLGVSTDYLLGKETEKAPTGNGERKISDNELKFALWGDCEDVSDEDLEDVRRYAAFVRERKHKG